MKASGFALSLEPSHSPWAKWAAHREAFVDVVESAIADRRITQEEDQWVAEVRTKLNVPAERVAKELALVDQLTRAAAVNAKPLTPVTTNIKLQRGETAFFVGAAVELKRVIARTVQRQGVQYSDYEYERQDEGQLVATNLRVLFVGQGSRTIKLEKIQRLEANVPDRRLFLSLDGRASPLVFGLDDSAVAGTIISRLSKELEAAA